MKSQRTDFTNIRIINAFKCVKTHGPNLGGAASQHDLTVKCHKYSRTAASRHMNPAAAVFHSVCHRICYGQLTSCYHYRNGNILKHKRQHRSCVRQCICPVDHCDSLIVPASFCDQLRQPCPVLRKNISTVHRAKILCFQFQIPGHHTKLVQHISAFHSRHQTIFAVYRRKRTACIYNKDSFFHMISPLFPQKLC